MMKSLICYTFLGLSLGWLYLNILNHSVFDKTYLVIPKYNLNKDFGIVASVSETDSLNDIIGRPLHSKDINQYYFKDTKDYINLMQPNIGISFSSEYNGNELSISDRVRLRLPKIVSYKDYSVVDISSLVKNNFYFGIRGRNSYANSNMYYFLNDSLNIEKDYYDKKVMYSLSFLNNKFDSKVANINHGYFITLTKTYDIYNSKLEHYITKWNCDKNITMYIDKSVPKSWIPIFESGLKKWNRALNDANKKCNINTISYLDDKWEDFRNGNIKYSSISLAPSSMDRTYAIGHSDFNWKTGEIYRGNIMVSGNWIDYWHKQFNFLEKILKVNQDKKEMGISNAQTCITDSALENNHTKYKNDFIKMGMESVIIHEMGHILGLRHNFKASSLVTFDDIHDKDRIKEEGLIPSIMDYLNLIVNTDNIYDCYTMDCIMDNINIMDHIGKYDYQTIQYGYGNNSTIEYDLGPDEFLQTDALSNTGDISDTPGKYHYRFLNLSKYVINNFSFKRKVTNFNTFWQEQADLVTSHYRYLSGAIKTNLKVLTSISYNFNAEILNIKKAQKESARFFKYLLEGKLYLDNKLYFMFPKCDVAENYYCQGMMPFDLNSTHNEMNRMLPMILTSSDFEDSMNSNFELTKKTISYRLFKKIMNDTLVVQNPFMQFFM